MIKLELLSIGGEDTPMYDLEWRWEDLKEQVKKYGLEQGYFLTEAELEQRDRRIAEEAFEKGHHAKIRQEYNSAVLKNFAGAAGRFVTVEEAFQNYWAEKKKLLCEKNVNKEME